MKQGKGMTQTDKIREMLRRKTSVDTIVERLKVNKNRVWWVRWDMGRKKNEKPVVKKAVAPKREVIRVPQDALLSKGCGYVQHLKALRNKIDVAIKAIGDVESHEVAEALES